MKMFTITYRSFFRYSLLSYAVLGLLFSYGALFAQSSISALPMRSGAQLRLSKLPDFPPKIDTLFFPATMVGKMVCSTLVYINESPVASGNTATFLSVSLNKNAGDIAIASVSPNLPATLKGGDTLKVQVCFKPSDTSFHQDVLVAETDCFTAPLTITGNGGTPLIQATDIDFGDVVVGTTECKTLTVRNVGRLPFLLTKNWLLHDQTRFSIDPSSVGLLPTMLFPGGKSITLRFCYSPLAFGANDSTKVDWSTDIPEPYTNSVKSFSILNGHPIKPSVVWDRAVQYFIPDSVAGIDSVIQRVHLVNNSGTKAFVSNMSFIGRDAFEFSIFSDQLGKYPPVNFDMNTGDSIWVDVIFKPDFAKLPPYRFADRIDTLVGLYFNPATQGNDSAFLKLIGTWTKSDVAATWKISSFSLRPNPSSGNSVTLRFSSPEANKVSFSIFDVLGREVYRDARLSGQYRSAGSYEEPVTLPNLETGIYYARLTIGNNVSTQELEIVK